MSCCTRPTKLVRPLLNSSLTWGTGACSPRPHSRLAHEAPGKVAAPARGQRTRSGRQAPTRQCVQKRRLRRVGARRAVRAEAAMRIHCAPMQRHPALSPLSACHISLPTHAPAPHASFIICACALLHAPLSLQHLFRPRVYPSMPRAGAGAPARLRRRSAHDARRAGMRPSCESNGRQTARAARGGGRSGRLRLLAACRWRDAWRGRAHSTAQLAGGPPLSVRSRHVRRAGAGGVTAGMLRALMRQALCTVPMRGSRLPALRGAQASPLDSYRAANKKTHDQPHPAAPQQERRPAPAAPPAAHRRRRRRGPRAAAAGVPGPRRPRPARRQRRRAARGRAATQPWRTCCRSRGPRCPRCRARGSGRRAPRRPRLGARRAPDARAQSPRPARVRSGVKRVRRWWSSAHSCSCSVLDMAK